MKTKRFFSAALLCCLGLGASLQASAESWRVNNNSKARADFADLNAAMASDKVSDGDTIYLENTADPTGATSGWFRIQAIEVSVSAQGAETITPIIERAAS
jgi:hypothetical protein